MMYTSAGKAARVHIQQHTPADKDSQEASHAQQTV